MRRHSNTSSRTHIARQASLKVVEEVATNGVTIGTSDPVASTMLPITHPATTMTVALRHEADRAQHTADKTRIRAATNRRAEDRAGTLQWAAGAETIPHKNATCTQISNSHKTDDQLLPTSDQLRAHGNSTRAAMAVVVAAQAPAITPAMIATDRSSTAPHHQGHATWANSEVTLAISLPTTNIPMGTAQLADILHVRLLAMPHEISHEMHHAGGAIRADVICTTMDTINVKKSARKSTIKSRCSLLVRQLS